MGIKSFFTNVVKGFVKDNPSVAKSIAETFGHDLRPKTSFDGFYQNSPNKTPFAVYATLKQLSFSSDVLTVSQNGLRREIFRNSFEVLPASELVKEDSTIPAEEIEVDESQRKEILEWLNSVNENGQQIEDVLKESEDDLNIFDNAFLLNSMQYGFNTEGDIIEIDYKEFLRVAPDRIQLIIDMYDRLGYEDASNGTSKKVYTCPIHRQSAFYQEGYCPQCRAKGQTVKLQQAFYKTLLGDNDSQVHYLKDEIIHLMKYRPSKRGGYSPVLTCWKKVKTLDAQDSYMFDAYFGKKDPKGLLVIGTANQDSVEKAYRSAVKFAEEYPNTTPPLVVDNTTGEPKIELISFMRNLEEMQFTETREEMWKHVGAVYGVSPIFSNDNSTSGGLNNEGLQITVTNRAVEVGQKIYNTKVMPKVFKLKGYHGWMFRLRPSEEQDEMAKLQRQEQSLRNGELAVSVGLDAEFNEDSGEVVIKKGQLAPKPTPQFSFGADGELSNETSSPEEVSDDGEPPKPKKETKKPDEE